MSSNTKDSYKEGLIELRNDLKQMLPAESLAVFDKDAEMLDSSFQEILKLKLNEKAPDFTLTNATGDNINLYSELKSSAVVLVFYRGNWCPYCNLALNKYQSILSEIKNLGARLISISSQTPDESLTMKEKNNLEFEVLSDNGNMVANLYTTVFRNGEKPLKEMEKLGFDFDSYYESDSKEIPVPAVFVIRQDGTISFAQTEGGDYRNRTEEVKIINALKQIK